MTHIIEDRVLELSTSTGSGAFALAGALTGFRALSSVMSVADTCWYYIEAIDADGDPTGAYEWGLGTYSAVNELTRTTVRGSSNGGAAVVFAAGNKLVGMGVPAPSSLGAKNEWRNALRGAPVVLTPGSTVSVDAAAGCNFTLTPAQNFTLANPTNLSDGMVLNFRIKQDGTGSRIITWGSKYKFPGGTAGVLSTAASAVDFMSCYYDATSDTLDCVLSKGFA